MLIEKTKDILPYSVNYCVASQSIDLVIVFVLVVD